MHLHRKLEVMNYASMEVAHSFHHCRYQIVVFPKYQLPIFGPFSLLIFRFKNLFAFIQLFLATITVAQSQVPFIRENVVIYVTSNELSWQNVLNRITYENKFEGTTIINDTLYHNLYSRIVLDESDDWKREYYLREESGKVWARSAIESFDYEYLLYDFTLDSVGQKFSINKPYVFELEVTGIDSIELLNGEKRKIIFLRKNDGGGFVTDTYWIEGIGSEDSPFYTYALDWERGDFADVKLQCYYQNDELIYQRDINESCAYFTVATDDMVNKEDAIFLFPNPCSSDVRLSISSNQLNLKFPLTVSIFSLKGDLVLYQKMENSSDLLQLIPAGYYFVRIINQKQIYISHLIVSH
jgi:hypothetical protein